MTNQRYDISNLEWQQFEVLAFKCVQLDVSKSVRFIEGGSDKGRDFIFCGVTNFFGNTDEVNNYIFQAKHKSTKNGFTSLNKDLKDELYKVFIKNKLDYNFYCLVTNLTITGKQNDILEKTFHTFLLDNKVSTNLKFGIYSYRHLESTIDNNNFLKWLFPSIIKNTDFKLLIENVFSKTANNISSGWLSVFNKNKSCFVYTNVFEEAIEKIDENNILLLSGPSKSGKTFNAEMILFKLCYQNSFIPYKVDKIDQFDTFYDKDLKQIFLFDDAFGRYNIDTYRADSFNRKLEYIFELIDSNHKCIFTSREYIYKAFLNYADKLVKGFITKITVEVSNLSMSEKESIFLRYHNLFSNKHLRLQSTTLQNFLNHKNFSPETVRAYFTSYNSFDHNHFLKHLDSPDEYLEKDFNNLSEEKQIALISTLLSLNGSIESISYSYEKIGDFLGRQRLVSLNNILDQLEGSMLKKNDTQYLFYHPSMFEFFVRYISKDTSVYRKIFFLNININLLNVISFRPDSVENVITIRENDYDFLITGFNAIIYNPDLTLYDINSILSWLSNTDIQLYLKIRFKEKYSRLKDEITSTIENRELTSFLYEDIHLWADFFRIISFNNFNFNLRNSFITNLLKTFCHDDNYWLLVFRLIPLLKEKFIFNHIKRDWFQAFFSHMRNEINNLGYELFGDAFPDFEDVKKYQTLLSEKKHKDAEAMKKKHRSDFKRKTNKEWYPRYERLKDKMAVLKASQPYGFKLYEKLIFNFSHLQAFEDNQLNRYVYNKEKKWW